MVASRKVKSTARPRKRRAGPAPGAAAIAGLKRQLAEARAQQAATAEVLRIISSSPTDTQPVFETIVRSCQRLFGGRAVAFCMPRGDRIETVAFADDGTRGSQTGGFLQPFPLDRGSAAGACILDRRVVNVPDTREAAAEFPRMKQLALALGYLSGLFVPLVQADRTLGMIGILRAQPGRFTEREVALAGTFADQAVIAVENARLFDEAREALERQTATAEILKVIASSPADVQPVFEAIADNAKRLLGGFSGMVLRYDGKLLHLCTVHSELQDQARFMSGFFPISPVGEPLSGRCVLERAIIQTPDLRLESDPRLREIASGTGVRAVLVVPMLRDGAPIGTISVARINPGAFSLAEAELLTTFADQAVIAIENVRLFNETKEALEQQRASADVLGAISGSITDTRPVFDKILERCEKLFEGNVVGITLATADGKIDLAAYHGRDYEKLKGVYPLPLSRESGSGAAILDATVAHYPDIEADGVPPGVVAGCRTVGMRAIIFAPMLFEGRGIGAIWVGRMNAGMFTQKQIALLSTFTDQAVIAIQNVRMFNETREALERQTATAEILKVISGSPTEVQPVFEAIVASGMRLFSGAGVGIGIVKGEEVVIEAAAGMGGVGKGFRMPLSRDSASGMAILERKLVNIADTEAPGVPPHARENGRRLGIRSMVQAPMYCEGEPIGSIGVMLKEAGGLDEKQLALLRTFADQAVIAIQNARLFNETREALERQTATAEVLKVIASSPSDVQPVFEAIAASARRLLDGGAALVARRDGDWLHLAAYTSTNEAADAALEKLWPSPITGKGHMGRAVVSASPVLVEDIQNDGSYSEAFRESARTRGVRSVVSVPMLREGEVIGVISVNRPVAGRFSEHQTNLLRTFADQAVIAIENVRLFKELQTRTEALTKSVGQLTALSEVGQAISSTLELDTVLRTIVSRAVQLSGLDAGVIYEYDQENDLFLLRASERFDESGVAEFRGATIRRGEGAVGRSVEMRQPTQVPDTHAPDYPAHLRGLLDRAGFRALLAVPLLREDHIVGALMVIRRAPGEFDAETVELLRTFAGQSALAIQNARLFREIAEKGRQLEDASRHKSDFLASMSHELRTPLNAILGFNEMILGQVYGEVPADMKEPLEDIQKSGKHLLRLINNVLDLAKIEAGRMELSVQEYSVQDTVESVRATLRPLAAEKGLEFVASVPGDLPLARGDGGRITQCLMNLAGNSLKFTKAGKVEIAAALEGDRLRFSVADTGVGIPADKIDSLFTEFKQTDASIASEYGGTGLGLSITKKFIEMHGGRIWVASEPGRGSTFLFEVPLRVSA